MIEVRLGGTDFTITDKIVVDYMKHKQTGVHTVADLEGEYTLSLNKPKIGPIDEEQEKRLSEIIDGNQ